MKRSIGKAAISRDSFDSAAALRNAVTQALHQFDLAQAAALLDVRILRDHATALIPAPYHPVEHGRISVA